MIYCVIPRELEEELFEKMAAYYRENPNVTVIVDRRAGRETHYSASPEGLKPLIDWIAFYGAFWRERFDALDDLLKRMDQ